MAIALPIVISNATVPILGAVDTGVIGQMGLAAPIGAVGIGAIILSSLYWIFGFLRMGTSGFASQAIGRGDTDETAAILSRALGIALIVGLFFIIFQRPIFHLSFLLSPASAEVEGMARSYMGIRVWSAPALISLYGITGWLIAAQRTRAVLVLQLWMNCLNILLDLWFVLGLDFGVEGVAAATVIAEWTGCGLGLWLCRGAFVGTAWRDKARVLDRAKLRRFAQVNSDIMFRSLALMAMFLSFMFYGAKFGDVPLAANHILLLFLEITAYAMDGLALAAETLVGQALGAGKRAAFRRAAKLTSIWGFGIGVAMALIFYLFGNQIIDIMTTAPDVRATAKIYLGWMIATPIIGAAAWMLDGIFIGATRTADMRNMMFISMVIYFAALLILAPIYGNHGLWMAFSLSFILRGATLAYKYPALERSVG